MKTKIGFKTKEAKRQETLPVIEPDTTQIDYNGINYFVHKIVVGITTSNPEQHPLASFEASNKLFNIIMQYALSPKPVGAIHELIKRVENWKIRYGNVEI